mgnify:CR=1 FL=1
MTSWLEHVVSGGQTTTPSPPPGADAQLKAEFDKVATDYPGSAAARRGRLRSGDQLGKVVLRHPA